MAHLIDKDALVTEIERLAEVKPIDELQPQVQNKIDWLSGKLFAINSLRIFLHTIEVKEVDLENYNKVKKLLSLSFMNFLDNNRTKDKMCLSNGECFDIEKAFDEFDFAKLFRYMEKYLKAQKGK